ncbi:hypothetical protein [Streptomyces sp. NPDC017529]|uniref:hypothetical protein n=1 Tax=Streptomyces sp. NPDC017529 TaxID=3365000 RepID=UPI0037A37FF2
MKGVNVYAYRPALGPGRHCGYRGTRVLHSRRRHGRRPGFADGKAVGGITRLDIKDKAGHIHKVTWTLKGDRLTQKVADVKGPTVEGVLVRPTTPGQATTRKDWTCLQDGTGAVMGGLGVAASVAGGLETGGASLAATRQ